MIFVYEVFDWWRKEFRRSSFAARVPFLKQWAAVNSLSDPQRPGDYVFEGHCLSFDLTVQRVPFRRSLAIARATTQAKTPFPLHEVHIIPVDTSDQNKTPSFCVIRKGSIDPILDDLDSTGARIDNVGVRHGNTIQWFAPRALEDLHSLFRHRRWWRRFLVSASTVLLLTCFATYAHSYLNYYSAEQHLIDEIDAKRVEALQVRKLLDRQRDSLLAVEAARKGKSQAVPVVRIWEELTRVLPDDVWVTDMAIDSDTLNIAGFAAQSAASLISSLDGSALFSEPSFTSPVVRIPGQNGERFEIRMKVRSE